MSFALRDGKLQGSYHLKALKQHGEQRTVIIPARTSPGSTRSASPVGRPGQGRKIGDWKKQ